MNSKNIPKVLILVLASDKYPSPINEKAQFNTWVQTAIKNNIDVVFYKGGNKTYTLMYEANCPKQYKCVYDPWSKEPNIDDVINSLNQIKKGND